MGFVEVLLGLSVLVNILVVGFVYKMYKTNESVKQEVKGIEDSVKEKLNKINR